MEHAIPWGEQEITITLGGGLADAYGSDYILCHARMEGHRERVIKDLCHK
jgi:hypothetical protein